MADSLLAPALISCTPRHASAPAPPPSPVAVVAHKVSTPSLARCGGPSPGKPCAHKMPPLDLAAVAASSRHAPADFDSTRDRMGSTWTSCMRSAEALRLQTPPGTERDPSAVQYLRQGLYPAERVVYKAPLPTESILFNGLVVDRASSAARARSKHRAARDDSYSKVVPSHGAATPTITTMASEAGAEAP
ncbi:unnamed protein product [Prorocentrum cordatum]|uniref:Uncharacterized protein n=1 Tax=Prorocentrum cordatum TaxID=2364126 RepID=A0ABN9UU58_9DINO|nr:unnamed protein product [Polarella glacialis]